MLLPHRLLKPLAALSAVLVLPACAGGLARKDDAVQFRYQDYAGEPVDTVDTLGRVTGWTSVSRDQLAVSYTHLTLPTKA